MKDNTFKINKDDKTYEYTILKVLVPDNIKFKYLIYTDGSENFASRFDIVDEQIVLNPIEEEYEWNYVNENIELEDKNE